MSPGLHLRVAEGIVARALWPAGARVAVAVSGGLDSVVLLDLLVRTRGVHRGALHVATFDHGTRPGSSADADFVAGLAEALELPLRRGREALGEGASEDACRRARHAFLDGLDVDVVALAHHADDQAETSLLGLLRGGGTRALAGMAWRRGRLVRPLLGVRRAELEAWAAHAGLVWREDPTNASPRYLRNRVRGELLPLLEALRPGATEALARGAGHAAADADLLEALAAAQEDYADESWARAWVASAPEALVRRALAARLGEVDSARLDAMLAAARRGRGTVEVSPRVSVVVDGARVRIVGAPALPTEGAPGSQSG
ncbi:MAG: tRNA lysidine(34) synthetase TilS [Alphaproteobacteria bacterium]|nr:tRNA lysidine(34) synthetase TilS [Alphaproteobacteria bacterium]